METLLFVAERGDERFEVVVDGGEGVYVLRYFGGQSTHDYLQNDIPMAYGCAEDEWGHARRLASGTSGRDALMEEARLEPLSDEQLHFSLLYLAGSSGGQGAGYVSRSLAVAAR